MSGTTITSAGAGSGLDLESIITASLQAKQTAFNASIATQQTTAQTTLSGIGKLKSALSTFKDTLDSLAAPDAFNARTISITQDSTNPVLSAEATTGMSNGSYNIIINSLAAGSRYESAANAFTSSTQSIATQDGTLTFNAGSKSFSVDVKAGDNLSNIRDRINKSGSNFGVSVNLVNSTSGTKLVIDSSLTGSGNELSISTTDSELAAFSTTGTTLTKTVSAVNASATIDGTAVTSSSNTFTDTIQGLKFTALRVSDKDSTTGALTANKLTVATDTTAAQNLVQKFVTGYNSLLGSLNALGKSSTYIGGVSQQDGGLLEGDSTVRSIKSYLFDAISTPSKNANLFSTMFDMGVQMANDGTLSIDSTKFSSVATSNFDQIGALFGGDSGLAKSMSNEMNTYVQTGGTLAQRQDTLNTQLSDINTKQSDFQTQLAEYEKSLRTKYSNLDTLIANMNSSAKALSALSSS
ncbi:flagellar filament capping protein FliD [Tolumonas lignilytica]|jgi:Flagellar capping protein|uniref:flagellar filament capping protein FliD n=1 Tax=Tolumonas lignilytica TaxID=1283284 RepID=UPI000571D050|nr:flagellar filament capping protein FliD [Tolumonas lignilytica]